MGEMIQIFDANMHPIGVVERDVAHTHGFFHQCTHFWLIHEVDGVAHLLFSRRSADKPTYPNLLCPTASGHIPDGESWKTCLELKEEIGISMPAESLVPLGVHVHIENRNGLINNEFVYSFMGMLPCPLESIQFPDKEVEAIVLISIADCLELFGRRTEQVQTLQYHPSRPGLASVKASLNDFVPDARTPDAHYYKMALYAQLYTTGNDVAIPFPLEKSIFK